jgi:hypothetical protein
LAVAIQVGYPAMSASGPNDQLPTGTVAGEHVQLDVDLFLKAFSTVLHVMAGRLPCAEGFTPGPQAVEGLSTVVMEDTPFNRGMYTAAGLFPDAAQRRSFGWRAVAVMGIAMEDKYLRYRNDTAGSMHIALATTVAMVRGSERTTKKDLRASFDIIFRRVLKTTEEWAAANPGMPQRH